MDSTSIGGSFSVVSAIEDVLSSIIDKKKHAKMADILNPFIGSSYDSFMSHPENTFDLHGRKLMPTKGEKMEFADVAKELGKELDLYYYFEKTIIGLCA
ncbi:14619_t:CDS:2 [Funneliformis caledonium]|uniref:14619_t:CDS:1 n=1 Tax=Funneliformis caledonium TaxID=1117310 RepID=A0A9N9E3J3_9GLOM|nr:14619_t:CDS:2 [Funneliformis caledonium]